MLRVKEIKNNNNGTIYLDPYYVDYLCFTDASGSSNTLTLTKTDTGGLAPSVNLEYSTDKVNWTTWTETNNVRTYTIPANGKVYLRGDNTAFGNTQNDTDYHNFSSSGNVNASGDLMTLLDKSGRLRSVGGAAFRRLFQNWTNLKSAPTISATSAGFLSFNNAFANSGITSSPEIFVITVDGRSTFYAAFKNCSSLTTAGAIHTTNLNGYTLGSMFENCTSLTTTPSFTISSISEANACYTMFKGCTSLTSASNITLNATTIPNSAYEQMFNECSALVSAPTITSSALTIGDRGLQQMFRNCTSLTTAPNLNISTLDSSGIRHCYDLFRNCSALTDVTKVKLNATTLYNQSYHSVFNGCTSLVTPPEIMATTYFSDSTSTTNGSFVEMFYNCSKLSTIKVHFTTWQNNGRGTKMWTYGTKSSGTFYKPSTLPSTKNTSGNTTNPHYIPYNWTVTNI